MQSAVMIGAGKIGRAFLARLMRASGYRVDFIDSDQAVIDNLHKYDTYPVSVVRPGGISAETVDGYTARHISDTESVQAAIRDAALIAVSVGAENVASVADYLAPALLQRATSGAPPVNILVCENMIGSNDLLETTIHSLLPPERVMELKTQAGFNAVCVGCTVPLPPARLTAENPLALVIDSYDELPVAASSILGQLPPLRGLKIYEHFDYCIRRKLFIHNMGHAVAAYAGNLVGHTDLACAMADESIRSLVKAAMNEAAFALMAAYPFAEGLDSYIEGLLALFANADMGDTLARIGRDPLRKTSRDDRLAGAYRFCLDHDCEAPHIAAGLAAALRFKMDDDPASLLMQQRIADEGAEAFLRAHCGLTEEQAGTVGTEWRRNGRGPSATRF